MSSRGILEVATAVVAGWCVIALPVILDPEARHYEAAFMPFMRDVVEGMKPYSLALLFGVGAGLGARGTAPSWVLGFASVATLPAWSVIDLTMGGTGHNLLPIEWFVYGLYGLVATSGALTGRALRRRKSSGEVRKSG